MILSDFVLADVRHMSSNFVILLICYCAVYAVNVVVLIDVRRYSDARDMA